MPQVTNGIFLGLPAGAKPGDAPVIFFVETTTPAASTDPKVSTASNGSLYTNTRGTTGSVLYCKIDGVWVNVA